MRTLTLHTEFRPQGLLFIGDPHVSSLAPGRRRDDYAESVLAKLSQAARICHERQLVPVVLGDLVHRDAENSMALLHRLLRVLREFPCAPIDLGGNHGKKQLRFSEGDIEVLLADAGALVLLDEPTLVLGLECEGRPVRLAAVPYGFDIPQQVDDGGNLCVLVTHHDLAFGKAYPGAIPPPEVRGAPLAVNGHVHRTYAPVQAGMTCWHNPGNIEPLSVDLRDHVPCVWEWRPSQGIVLTPHQLEHATDCFDLTGLAVSPADAQTVANADIPLLHSRFAELLRAESALEMQKLDTADAFLEELTNALRELKADEATSAIVMALARQLPQM
jgi:hypothetical protein